MTLPSNCFDSSWESPHGLNQSPGVGITAYYENNVIGGPGAFVVEAQNFEAFGQLLIGKLIKEIADARPGKVQ